MREVHLVHGVQDAPLHRFEAVADVGQGAVQDRIDGVALVGFLHVDRERLVLNDVGLRRGLSVSTLAAVL